MNRRRIDLQKSWEERQALAPKTLYPPDLPIVRRKEEIIAAIRKHQVLIIAGETGSGKSTQIPKMCLDAGRGIRGLIGCTQPRRVAAITVAQRIAEELGEQIGQSVAYKIRFDEKAGQNSYIKLMTDGVLLMEAHGDNLLRRYDTIIVDEAHERSLNIDFIIGILRTILPRRPDLKVIITSATIDTEKFSQAFNEAPIIQISGRLYPVELRYRPLALEGEDNNGDGCSYLDAAVDALEALRGDREQGDVLIFMPTEQDIRETCDLLAGRFGKNMTILPMFSRLTWAEQQRVFQPSPKQKIVVATNVAETSITIPNIRYVIDTGLARIAQYNPRTRTASLPIQNISRSSADQRQGRCGRVRNGVCIRLYEKNDYLIRPAFTPPEIIRANLAGVILRMLYLAIGDVYTFPFLDPPAKKQLTDGMEILKELGAIRIEEKPILTDIGRLMARLPLDPRIARMIIEAMKRGCLDEILIITAALSIVDPRERPQEKAAQADQMHARFRDPASDFVTLLRIWNFCHEAGEKDKSQGQLRKFCREHFLSYRRMREWQDLHHQLRVIVTEEMRQRSAKELNHAGRPLNNAPSSHYGPDQKSCNSTKVLDSGLRRDDDCATIHKAILSGLLSGIALKKEKNMYTAPKGKEAMIFPGSGLFKRGGQWIVAAEWVETSRLYARTVATIEPEWIEEVAGPLCRVTYSEPHWSKERGEVQAFSQVSLFGLLIIPRRIVSYGRIDPAAANDIFIREGLMQGAMKRDYPFLRHNEEVIEKVRIMENKLRRQGVFLDEGAVFSFYRRQLPTIHDERTFQKYIRQQGGEDFLRMKEEDILLQSPDTEALSAWPDEAFVHGVRIPLTYRFTPGTPEDGVTAEIPASIITALSPHSFEMAVPGLLPEQVHSLVKGLPKLYRKQLPPLKTVAETLVMNLNMNMNDEQNLPIVLGRILKEQFGVTVPPAVWPLTALPDQLKMRFVVADENGQTLASSRDINSLHEQFFGQIQSESFQKARKAWERENIVVWDFGDLPESVPLGTPGQPAGVAFPALELAEGKINLRLFPTVREAEASHRSGVAALYEKHFEGELKYLRKTLVPTGNLKIWAETFGGTRAVARILYNKVIHDLFFVYIRNKELFIEHAKISRSKIIPKGQETLSMATPVLGANFQTIQTLNRLEKENKSHVQAVSYLRQLRQELAALLPHDFLEVYPQERITQLSRYICAQEIRANRGLFHLEKALERTREIHSYATEWQILRNDISAVTSAEKKAAINELFWMIEEYKVSLFAQEIKTPFPISGKRLEKKIAEIQDLI